MLESYIRPTLDTYCFKPIAEALFRYFNFHPNHITLASLCTGIIAALFIAVNQPLIACTALLVSGLSSVVEN